MEAFLILNPKAGNAASADLLEMVESEQDAVEVLRADEPGQAREIARERCGDADLVIVAGGDGTLNQVVGGLWDGAGGPPKPAIAILPLGTGNDLARTLRIPDDPARALALALRGARRKIDLMRVEQNDRTFMAANVCAGGFSGAMNEHLTSELKRTWGPMAYLLGAARTLPDLSGYEVRIAWDDGPDEPVEAFNVVVANGRTAGGGIPAAPRANPEDGLLDVVIVRQGTAGELGALAAKFLGGDYLDDEMVIFRRARKLRVAATPGMWFTADGELLGNEPISFTVVPQALEVVVGPRYVSEVIEGHPPQ